MNGYCAGIAYATGYMANENGKEYLPAGKKAVQTITNSVGDDYIGKTCAIYYQSADEIIAILDWINGEPKNQKIWEKWEELIWKQS